MVYKRKFLDELWDWSAVDLVRAMEQKQISPVELLEVCLDRYHHLNPSLNAVVCLNPEALQAAQDSEVRIMNGERLGPLDGIPITVKDNIYVKGLPATWGSKLFEHFVPDRDEQAIARLRDQGAIIFGKTNVPEFTLQGYTDNHLFGVTRNPWNLNLTPGGSSGGAVVSVAAGMVPFAIGTDGGGSIRRPAAYTGLVGLKPSIGRIPRKYGFPHILYDFEVIGPIARTVQDVALLYQQMLSESRIGEWETVNLLSSLQNIPDSIPSKRILYIPKIGDSPVDPEISASVRSAALVFQQMGHQIEEGEAPFTESQLNRIWTMVANVGLAFLLNSTQQWQDQVSSFVLPTVNAGKRVPATEYIAILEEIRTFRLELAEWFRQFDLILTPSAAALPWPAEEAYPAHINGQPVSPRGHAVFTGFVNIAGLPAIALPAQPTSTGLPIGFQLVGQWGAENLLLTAGRQYERLYRKNWSMVR